MTAAFPQARIRLVVALLVVALGTAVTVNGGECPQTDSPSLPYARPFKRAIIFSGMGPDWIVYLGMYDGAVDAGYQPDVILGTSGGAVAAGVIAAYPDREQRRALLASAAFHEFMLAPRINRPRMVPLLARSVRWRVRAAGWDCFPPALFAAPVLDLQQHISLPGLNRPFPVGAERPKLILISGRINPAFFRRTPRDRKYFTEAWFTDRDTATLLAGQASAVGRKHPDGYVRACGVVVDDVPIGAAVRASAAEPYMVAPALVNGEHYIGGGVNLWPVELARSVAHQVMIARTSHFGGMQEAGSHSGFGFSQQARQREVEAHPVDLQVDLTDAPGAPGSTFWPSTESKRRLLVPQYRLVPGVPEDRAVFLRRVAVQWRFGYERGRAAFSCTPCRLSSTNSPGSPAR